MRLAFLLTAVLWMTACGGGDAPVRESTHAKPLPKPPADERPVIVAFGNSLTAGFGVDAGKSYPDFLQTMLDERGYHYRVVNAGINGDTTSGGVERLDTVLLWKPEIVVVELGANDGLRGLPPASTRANLDEMIVALKKAGSQVVLAGMTLPRNYGPDYIRSFEQIFTGLAKKHSLPLIAFFLAGVAEGGRHMQEDRLHPTVEGNRIVAENVFQVLEPLLKK